MKRPLSAALVVASVPLALLTWEACMAGVYPLVALDLTGGARSAVAAVDNGPVGEASRAMWGWAVQGPR